MGKEFVNGSKIAVVWLMRVGFGMMVLVMYIGGLVSLNELELVVPVGGLQYFAIQVASGLSVFAFFFTIVGICFVRPNFKKWARNFL